MRSIALPYHGWRPEARGTLPRPGGLRLRDAHGVLGLLLRHRAVAVRAVHAGHGAQAERGGHDAHAGHGGHDKHAGHSVAMFRDRFWLSLLMSVPVLIWSEMLQSLLGYTAPSVPAQARRSGPAICPSAVIAARTDSGLAL